MFAPRGIALGTAEAAHSSAAHAHARWDKGCGERLRRRSTLAIEKSLNPLSPIGEAGQGIQPASEKRERAFKVNCQGF